jgi:hypothetical protein
MATVYLHIGAPKTATSTLQSVLAANYRKLLGSGVLYPQRCRHGDAHHTLICDLIEQYQDHRMPDLWYGDRSRGEAWQLLAGEIAEHAGAVQTVILSSELFFGQSHSLEQMLAEIRARLSGHQLKVVIYLRRQDQLYSSFYNQDVKGVRQWTSSAYQFYETHQIFRRSYDQILDLWSAALGPENVLVRPYEPAQWVGADIVEDFCSLIGIAPLAGGQVSHNESLGPGQLYLKQCLNRVGFDKADNQSVLQTLLKICPEQPLAQCIYVNKGLYRKYRQQWLKVNERLSRDYLGGEPLFHEPIPGPEQLTVYETDPARILEFVLALHLHFLTAKDSALRGLYARGMLLAIAEQNLWQAVGTRRQAEILQWLAV